MNFMFVWPSLLKGVVGGFVRNFAMDIFQSHPIPFTHPEMPIARGGWRNSPAGKPFPFEIQYQTEMLPEWTLTQRMSKPLFGHREKSNLAPDQCEIVAGSRRKSFRLSAQCIQHVFNMSDFSLSVLQFVFFM